MLTILIPTRNRSQLIRTQLAYFAETKLPYKLLLIDASDDHLFEVTARNFKIWSTGVDAQHRRAISIDSPFSTKRIHGQLLEGMDHISTPFTSILPDDDFLVPNGLVPIVNLMEKNPGLGMGTGRSLAIRTKGIGADAPQELRYGGFRQADLPWTDPMTRICNHISSFTGTAFAVHRTEILKNSLTHASDLELPSFLMEVLQSCVAIAQGPVKRIDQLYLIRHVHERAPSSILDLKKFSLDIFDPEFPKRFKSFISILQRALATMSIAVPDDYEDRLQNAFSYLVIQKRLQRFTTFPQERITQHEDFRPLGAAFEAQSGPIWDSISPTINPIMQNIRVGLVDDAVMRDGT